jgi:hypothetical protein
MLNEDGDFHDTNGFIFAVPLPKTDGNTLGLYFFDDLFLITRQPDDQD